MTLSWQQAALRFPYRYFIRFGEFGTQSLIGFDEEFRREVLGGATHERGVSALFAWDVGNGRYKPVEPPQKYSCYGHQGDYLTSLMGDVHDRNIFLIDGDLIPIHRSNVRTLYDEFDQENYDIYEDAIADAEYELEALAEDLGEGHYSPTEYASEFARLQRALRDARYKRDFTYATGADGEPLLKNAVIVQQLRPDQVTLGYDEHKTMADVKWNPRWNPRTSINEMVRAIQANLTPDLLRPDLRSRPDNPLYGHCYVSTEALLHLLRQAGERGYAPFHAKDDEGIEHWWLQNAEGDIIDVTEEQYWCEGRQPPHEHGVRGRGGMATRKKPSKRAQMLLERLR